MLRLACHWHAPKKFLKVIPHGRKFKAETLEKRQSQTSTKFYKYNTNL